MVDLVSQERLPYKILDGNRDVHQLLQQKRDGSSYLLLWLEVNQSPAPVASYAEVTHLIVPDLP